MDKTLEELAKEYFKQLRGQSWEEFLAIKRAAPLVGTSIWDYTNLVDFNQWLLCHVLADLSKTLRDTNHVDEYQQRIFELEIYAKKIEAELKKATQATAASE